MQIPFDNRYATLGEGFFEKIRPTPVKKLGSLNNDRSALGPVLRERLLPGGVITRVA